MNSILLGALGEQSAARFLRGEKYKIVAANFKTYVGEIDLVAEKGKEICFVEVKTRQVGGMFAPAEAVDYRKRENIKGSAAAFLKKYQTDLKPRFDIIEVLVEGKVVKEINHIKNAF